MKKAYKFICRLIVGFALIVIAIYLFGNQMGRLFFPGVKIKDKEAYVQNISGEMSDPNKTYAKNAISEASRENKIAIVLDYQLKTFQITDTYIDNVVGSLTERFYLNQPYIVYTYFKDSETMVITTNIDNAEDKIVDKTINEIETETKIVKEILYYQQNLKPQHGLVSGKTKLTPEYSAILVRDILLGILCLALGLGVQPLWENSEKRKIGKRAAKVVQNEKVE